jgi:DNA adenine methylase
VGIVLRVRNFVAAGRHGVEGEGKVRKVTKRPVPKVKLTPPLKWHGGKSYLASVIVNMMPPRCANPNAPATDDPGWLHYVEPYAGGLAVLMALDPEGISEVVNDLNGDLTNFWRVMQDADKFEAFRRIVKCVPFSQAR